MLLKVFVIGRSTIEKSHNPMTGNFVTTIIMTGKIETDAKAFVDAFNSSYEDKHTAFENQVCSGSLLFDGNSFTTSKNCFDSSGERKWLLMIRFSTRKT